jgi:hypothetical protein
MPAARAVLADGRSEPQSRSDPLHPHHPEVKRHNNKLVNAGVNAVKM